MNSIKIPRDAKLLLLSRVPQFIKPAAWFRVVEQVGAQIGATTLSDWLACGSVANEALRERHYGDIGYLH